MAHDSATGRRVIEKEEIEVTPEMIDIGLKRIRTYFDEPDDFFTRFIVEELISEILECGR
jgi:hypothetical protein